MDQKKVSLYRNMNSIQSIPDQVASLPDYIIVIYYIIIIYYFTNGWTCYSNKCMHHFVQN